MSDRSSAARRGARVTRTSVFSSVAAALAATLAAAASAPAAEGGYELFESVPVRPLALSADGGLLFAANTADNRVEVFVVGAGGSLASTGEVQVGLEPVAIAARGNDEIWVTNHLSDSVSRIDVSDPTRPRVTHTVLVGDEPRDIVIGGTSFDKVFVACARRGQNRPGDPQLTTPGVGRGDVWVIDADDPAAAPDIVTVFGDTPRALAVSPDGSDVYAAVHHSGTQTTVLREGVVRTNGGLPPLPPGATAGGPSVGLIVKWDGTKWTDEIGRNWNFAVPYSLPDRDVFILDADADPPVETGFVTGVGSMLFNMAVRPSNGDLFVTGQNARNEVRFEPVLKGHLAEQNVTIVSGTTASIVHLNPHVDYGQPGSPVERAQSVGTPLDIVFSDDGTTAYVAGFGSSNVAVLDGTGAVTGRIGVGHGPAGLALREDLDRLFVLNHFDKTISVVDTSNLTVTGSTSLRFDPEPPSVRDGRAFLYDTVLTSAHGDNSCATCHLGADMDRKAWDLGDPFGAIAPNPTLFPIIGTAAPFHPLKGPMTTQSLRGMADAGPMHWRGDKNGGFGDPNNEEKSFKEFNPAFVGLLGRDAELDDEQMQAFADFILQVRYPPNPVAPLDGTLTASQARGAQLFVQGNHDIIATCEGCHNLPFGTGGFSTFEGEPQNFKVAHLRNGYAKLGMFRSAGDQVAETGFLHDGAVATIFEFLGAPVFNLSDAQQRDLEAFSLAFDTGFAPVVGQQVTATVADHASDAIVDRIELLRARDEAGDCELIAKGAVAGTLRGARYVDGGHFRPDANGEALIPYDALRLRAATPGQEVTYTCVYPGGGQRMGIDRDLDGYYDATETAEGSDQADASSTPVGVSHCGDGVADAGEECDGDDFGGTSCVGLGFGGGTPTCEEYCTLDPSTCITADAGFNTRSLKVSKLRDAAGRQKVALKSDRLSRVGISISPPVEDLAVTLSSEGSVLWEAVIPASDPRWRTSGAAWKWVAGSGGHADGLRTVKVENGSPFAISLKTVETDALALAGRATLDILMTIGGDTWAGSVTCSSASSGSSLSCE